MENIHSEILKINRNSISSENILQKSRNFIVKIPLSNGKETVVKFFKKPNFINSIVYRHFRKSKAKRSYEYAKKLFDLGIGTPEPICFYEEKNFLVLKESYYACEFVDAEYTFRDLTLDNTIPDFEKIVRSFTKFTYNIHEKNVIFLDHSPGNTLIKKTANGFDFFLVDLNRMLFEKLDFDTRMKNFSRLTKEKHIIDVIADEYAKLGNYDSNLVHQKMHGYIDDFQQKYHRKKELKRKLRFWK